MNYGEHKASMHTPFWPVCLMALSLALFLGWQVAAAMRQRGALLRVQGRQEMLAGQAAEAEGRLQPLIVDLLNLARTDADAKAIVAKYRINVNPAAQPASPLPNPAPAPAPQGVAP